MLLLLINRTSKVIALTTLAVIIFTFLNSELVLLNYSGNSQACQDYCEIVKNANTHSKFLQDELLNKLELNKDISIHCFEEIEAQATQTFFERTTHPQTVKLNTKIYLFDRAFLI